MCSSSHYHRRRHNHHQQQQQRLSVMDIQEHQDRAAQEEGVGVDHPNPSLSSQTMRARGKREREGTSRRAATATANSNTVFLRPLPPSLVNFPPPLLHPKQWTPEEEPNENWFFSDYHLINSFRPPPLAAAAAPPSPQVFEDLTPIIKQHLSELQGYLVAQDEQLRKMLLEKWQRHFRAFLYEAELAAAVRIREKESQAEQVMRQLEELQRQLLHARAETAAWQSEAMASQANAVAAGHDAAVLRAHLERALAALPEGTGESSGLPEADDADSGQLDVQLPLPTGSCRVCHGANAAVVAVVPCGHLCLCADCAVAGAAALACPWCGQLSGRTVRVIFC